MPNFNNGITLPQEDLNMKRFASMGLAIIALMALIAGGCGAGTTTLPSSGTAADAMIPAAHQPTGSPQYVDPSRLANMSAMLDIVEHSVLEVNVTVTTTNTAGIPTQEEGAGSAWVLNSSGMLITNNHVIEGASEITVTTIEGQTYTAALVNTDPESDIAVLRVNNANLTPLKVGDSSLLRVGDWVVTIGNPLGQGISAKQGIVSRIGVDIPFSDTQIYREMIEVSAAINPGNSGGPLVNLFGEVVGINTIKVSDVGIEGMGYATSMTLATPVIQRLSGQ
jgi:S1-C subfamily serine protease